MSRPVVLASPYGGEVKLAPQGYLGPRFNAYRDAVVRAGARYLPSIKANVLALDRLAIVRDALNAAGFDLAVASELREALTDAAEAAQVAVTVGAERLADVTEILKARGLSLFPYQRDGVRWLAPRRAALLADEMGLGKTVQCLMALPEKARAMVFAPAAVAANWVTETRRWRPDLRPRMLPNAAAFQWPREGEVLVATYGALPNEGQEITMPPSDVYLIADEAHMLKGGRGRKQADGTHKGGVQRVRRWFAVQEAVAEAGGTTWLLTGTPLVNRPNELWRVLAAAGLAEQAFGSWPRFMELAGGSRTRYGTKYAGTISDEVPLALQKVSLRRERLTVLPDLPRKIRQIDTVPLADGEALRLCDELVSRLEELGCTVDDLADMGNMAKAGREVVFEMIAKTRAALAAAKTPALLELVEAYEDEEIPTVVFCSHLAPLKALAARPGWGLIDGSVSAEDRGKFVAQFQAGELRGMACSYAAGGVGITLTRAHHAIMVDLPWTPALLAQAEDRICRIGSEADSIHIRILAADHPVDHRVAEIQVEKTATIEATVNASAVEELPHVDTALAEQATALAELAASTVDVTAKVEEDASANEALRELRFPKLVAMLSKAAESLKYPQIRFQTEAGSLRLTVATVKSKYPGSLNVTDTEGSFETRKWYGRIRTGGEYDPTRDCPGWVTETLVRLEEDPAGMAKAYGQKYGHCCFCSIELTDARSVQAGYGPICAEKYGLPWGGPGDELSGEPREEVDPRLAELGREIGELFPYDPALRADMERRGLL